MNDDPAEAHDWYKTGCELTNSGKLSEAVRMFTRIIDSRHHQAEAYFRRGVCHYLRGEFRKAEADMNAATLLGCVDAQIWSRYDIQPGHSPEHH